MKPESSLPYSQEHASCSMLGQINPVHDLSTFRKSILILSSHLLLGLRSGVSSLVFPHQNPVLTYPLPRMCSEASVIVF
jgi:hypothetical protein